MKITGTGGSDGSGGKEKESTQRRTAAAAFVFDPANGQFATIHTRVPGRQNVPRSELWAIINMLTIATGERKQYTFFIDAQ